MNPLVEHLSSTSTSGFLSVCVVVTDVISTAVRDAKSECKAMYYQMYWRKELVDERMDTNPEAQRRGKVPQRKR